MENTKLKASHKRLTFLFIGIVLFVLLVFWISVLATKYFTEQSKDKKEFEAATQKVVIALWKWETILPYVTWEQKQRLQNYVHRINEAKQENRRFFVSFFILDSENRISFENIVERPDFERLVLDSGDVFYIDDETMVRVAPLKSSILWDKIVFYKSLKYSGEDFLYDILGLIFLSFFLSIVLYFIGYRFVWRALKPVEENLRDMSDFIHNAGHELKTPLAVIRGNLQVMQAEKKYDKQLLAESIVSIDHSNELIESLRELSEVGKLSDKENLVLVWEVESIQKKFQDMLKTKNIEFLWLTSEKHVIFANRHELQLLLSNLVKNAIKYTEKGGKIDVTCKKNRLSIKDSGSGIPAGEQEKIFERFYQWNEARNQEGYGIGLSLVKKIADTNNWKIELVSKEWKGSIFTIIF